MKKIDYITLISFLGCIIGMARYLILYLNNKQIIDLVAFIIILIVFIILITSLIIVKIIKRKQNKGS